MKLYFENNIGELRLIAVVDNEKEAIKEIDRFLSEHNYKSYYTRTWMSDNNKKIFDVGSWTEFFVLDMEG